MIAGAQQARIVPDYTVQDVVKPPQPKANGAAATEINISPLPPEVGVAAPVQMPAFGVEGDAVIAPPVVPPSAAGGSAPPGVVNKGSLATEPGSTGASTAPVQGATSEPIVTPPASGAAATTH